VVAHGFNANPERNWFPWLIDQYQPGIVSIPRLPDPTAAELEPWVTTLTAALGDPDEETVLVGHSLGTITCLRVLERFEKPWKLGGLILVAGFYELVPEVPALDAFTEAQVRAGTIIDNTRRRQVIGSDDDDRIIPRYTARLARLIDAPLMIVPGQQHFSDSTGVRSLPDILPIIDEMLGSNLDDAKGDSRR
jgi:predicted alpha/beta hydrolase family esterase